MIYVLAALILMPSTAPAEGMLNTLFMLFMFTALGRAVALSRDLGRGS